MKLTQSTYFSTEANREYMSASQFKAFLDCPAAALAEIRGEYERPTTTALLEGSYLDAHFSGEMETFKETHPEIFNKRTGALKAEFRKADDAIELVEQDPFFMEHLQGEHQRIITGELFGVPFKAKIDNMRLDEIIDFKYMRDIKPIFKAGERKTFIEAYNYHIQAFIYQRLVYQLTGLLKPFRLAVVTKEEPADHYLFSVDQWLINSAGSIVKHYAPIFDALKKGDGAPERCGVCPYCRSTKKLTKITGYETLLESL